MPCIVGKQKYKKIKIHFVVGTNDQNGLHREFDTLAKKENVRR